MDPAIAPNLCLEPLRDRVDTLGPDPVQTARDLVGTLTELPAGVKIGEHQLERGHLVLLVHIHGNPAAVILD